MSGAVRNWFILCVISGTVLIASVHSETWFWLFGISACGGGWLATSWRGVRGRANLFGPLFVLVSVAAYLLPGYPLDRALVAVILSLSAWDLDHFMERVDGFEGFERAIQLQRGHLLRLLLVNIAGLIAGRVVRYLNFPLTFGWAALVSAMCVLGLVTVVRHLRWEQ